MVCELIIIGFEILALYNNFVEAMQLFAEYYHIFFFVTAICYSVWIHILKHPKAHHSQFHLY